MSAHTLRRLLAVAATVAILTWAGHPAASNTSHTAEVTDGLLILAKAPNPNLLVPLDPSADCPTGALTFSTNPHPGAEITALAMTRTFAVNAVPHLVVITRWGSDMGTMGNQLISSVGVDVSLQFYTVAPGTSCTAGSLRCAFDTNANLELEGVYNDADLDNEIEINEVGWVDAGPVGITASAPCLPPFSVYPSGVALIDGMEFILTS